MTPTLFRSALVIFVLSLFTFGQQLAQRPAEIKKAPPKLANANATYQQLRAVTLGGDAVDVKNLVLKRDIATFTFESGTIQFATAVNGMVTGAAFVGRGSVSIEPVLMPERDMLKKLSKGGPYQETFSTLVLRFTDGTDKEIKSNPASSASATPKGSGAFDDIKRILREDLHYNLSGRILNDVLVGNGAMFWAFIDGEKYSRKQVFEVDPYGAISFSNDGPAYDLSGKDFTPNRFGPEEVVLFTYDVDREALYVAEHLKSELQGGNASLDIPHGLFDIEHQVLDTQIEKSGKLLGDAQTTVNPHGPTRVVGFDLYHKLHVDSVTYEDGQAADFIQEGQKADWGFFVVFPATKQSGDTASMRITYGGKDAVANTGGGNYFPIARSTWYPNTNFGDYATYDLTFRIPKKHKMAATGILVHEADEGDANVSTWKASTPQAVAGFSFGRFKSQQVKLDQEKYVVTAYANEDQPDWVIALNRAASGDDEIRPGASHITGVALGTMSTTPMLKRTLSEAQLAMQLYTKWFGGSPYPNLSVTQQTACGFGQAWPGLVYLPICAFFDNTVRHQLGMDDDRGYWQVVGPHEVAHQWWGHRVGFSGGRDQWMSEGFAEFSASIFLQQFYDNAKYSKFWKDELDLLTERNKEGARAIDVGPLVLGYRLGMRKTGWDVPRRLIYPKGAFVLHMVRMMMWDQQHGDRNFQAMMKDFGNAYANTPATTEDFKTVLEKHMSPQMNLTGDGKMDWFFNQYVYGTALPSYHFEHSFSDIAPGKVRMHVKIVQSNVDNTFGMLVPLYLELANGSIARLGNIGIAGNNTFEQDIDLPLQQKPKRAMINYYYDVLALQN